MSQTADSEPKASAPSADVATPNAAPPRLGAAATFGWSVLIFAIGQAAGTAMVAIINLANGMPALMVTGYDGMLVALLTLVTNPVQVALFAGVARWRTGGDPVAYLALTRFSARDFVVGFVSIAALATAINLFSRAAGLDTVSPFETDIFTSSRAEGWLAALVLAIVVVGPIGEEVMFRGFLFRGWVVSSGWRGALAIVIITMLWSAMHIQYDWFGISQVFLTGLVLGWIRWRSGSCLLTIVLHMLVNLESTIEAMIRVSGT